MAEHISLAIIGGSGRMGLWYARALRSAGHDRKSCFHRRPFELWIHFEIAEIFFPRFGASID